ncbi:MAG: SGNH/GDSL hydrolase family protein [Aquabacterium sp.]|uniref:SGNH/GDSL hydrolase family protein n=1 Tax=Aquabacterium sp. TaxID=1872578 RepID=UPI002A360E02|nr:SGNH/GDSL hydrolase family protein [Aquabacterium sp.]MDX9842985.1 SGNH/GDSL hydrolase family protein [Aquabacterium sp.]
MERWLHGALTLSLAPLLLVQGRWVRRRTPVLPEPPGPRAGVIGQGPVLRLLVVGDSSAAGVGAAHQDEALTGRLTQDLSRDFTVHWRLQACTGHKLADVRAAVRGLPAEPFDVVVVAVGVNDATGRTHLAHWLHGLQSLVTELKQRHQAQQVILSALPPVHLFPALPQPLRWYLGRCATRLDKAQRRWVAGQPDCEVLGADFPMDLRYMAQDGFHPGALAYEAWAAALAERIRAHARTSQISPGR